MKSTNSNPQPTIDPLTISWSWQTNKLPWLPNQARTWSDYPSEISQKVEKAYTENKDTLVDIGDYFVDLKAMVQFHKVDVFRQRRVQRTETGNLLKSRAERFIGTLPPLKALRDPTNMTDVFLQKIKQFNFEAEKALKLLDPLSNDIELLTAGSLAKIDEVKKSAYKEEEKVVQKIIDYIEKAMAENKNDLSGKKIYPVILKSFTEECFLYKVINCSLGEDIKLVLEEWASYILLLLYSFSGNEISWKNNQRNVKNISIPSVIYRGALLYQEDIEIYDRAKNRYFCWNTFTSTSQNRDRIKEFIKTIESDKTLRKTFFTIQIQDYNESRSKLDQLVNVCNFSQFPEEEEILICPGTIFEIITAEYKDNIHNINLRLVTRK